MNFPYAPARPGLLLLALLGLVCWPVSAPGLLSEPPPAPAPLEVRGLLVPSKQARLASRAKGVIEKIAREGQVVAEGEMVMELEREMERLQLAQQEHILDLRTFEWQASTELNEKSVISQVEVQEKRVNFEIAKVQLEQARQLLDRRHVSAPFAGVVAERLREEGEAVDEFTPILLLVDLSTMHLEVFLPGAQLSEVTAGQTVEVSFEDGRPSVQGKVTQISPTVNPASGEFRVRVALPNPDRTLVAGTYARARFGPGEKPSPARQVTSVEVRPAAPEAEVP